MITTTASMHCNVYLIKNVYYGCGIFSISRRQEELLKKTCKLITLRKLKLSTKFPRNILHTRKLALGVRSMAPSTVINILALRAHISHQRGESNISKIIQILEENVWIQCGYSSAIIDAG